MRKRFKTPPEIVRAWLAQHAKHTLYCRWKDGQYHDDLPCTCGLDDATAALSAWQSDIARAQKAEEALRDMRQWAWGSLAASPTAWVKAKAVADMCDAALQSQEKPRPFDVEAIVRAENEALEDERRDGDE